MSYGRIWLIYDLKLGMQCIPTRILPCSEDRSDGHSQISVLKSNLMQTWGYRRKINRSRTLGRGDSGWSVLVNRLEVPSPVLFEIAFKTSSLFSRVRPSVKRKKF